MLTKTQAFKLSYYSLTLAFFTIVGVPVGCSITRRNNSGWDFLTDDITFLAISAFLFIVLSLVSLISGLYALKKHRVAIYWIVPIGICLILAVCGLLWGAYVFLMNPFG